MSLIEERVTKEQVIELNVKLVAASEAYYKKNQPVLSDHEFDAMERRLRDIVTRNPEFLPHATVLAAVGNDLTGARVPHAHPMLSIENKYEHAELLEWYNNLPPDTAVCLEPKFDGISVSLIYKNHHLMSALTRGNGESGEDITAQAYAVIAIPKILSANLPPDIEVRGELVMRNSTLEELNREAAQKGGKIYTSTRNLTGGTMKLKDTKLIPSRQIQFMPWDVLGEHERLSDSGLERLLSLIPSGFHHPLGVVAHNQAAVGARLKQKLEERKTIMRDQLSLETDGVVVKVDSYILRKKLGVSRKFTNYQVCFKPQSASGTTYLRSIEWQVGRTGKLSPVATCDPVVLAGAKIERANLNNITWIREKNLKLGAKVEMLRSGDVIPQIVRVLDEGESEIVPPSNCPECLTLLDSSDEGGAGTLTHRCPNKGCPGRVRDTLTFIGNRDVLEIDGLGPEMAVRLAKAGYATDLAELYEFQTECLNAIATVGENKFVEQMRAKGFDVTILKMVKSLENAKTASWDRWIKALSIPMIGATLGKTVAMELDLQPDGFEFLVSTGLIPFTTREVGMFGEAKMEAIRSWCTEENNKLCYRLFQCGVRPTPVEKLRIAAGAPLKSINFCITGEFSEERDSIANKLISLGAAEKSSVSSKVNLLIVGEGAGKSKLKKAEELGIKQVGKDWLASTLRENGLQLS